MSAGHMSRVSETAGAGLLVLSGAAALVYQALWIKQLSLVVGVDVHAVTSAVSAFFAGLALGGFLFGPRADRTAYPLRLFAYLELAVAVTGVVATAALSQAASTFVAVERAAGPVAWLLPFVLVGVPATFMGGTLPALLRAVAPKQAAVGRSGGRLYAANTAGGIAGVLAAPFALIPAFGVRGTALAAAAMNLVAAATAIWLARRATAASAEEAPGVEPAGVRAKARAAPDREPTDRTLALALYSLAGAIALGYEVVWSHVAVQFMSTRAFAFSTMLATYLAGLAAGSALYTRFAGVTGTGWATFGGLVAGAGCVALAAISIVGTWLLRWQTSLEALVLTSTGSLTAAMCARFLVAALGIVFVPSVLLGAAFPAAVRISTRADRIGHDTGALLAWNTAGGIAGTLLTGFLILPAFGSVPTLAVLALAAAAVGVFAALRHRTTGGRLPLMTVAIAAVTLVLAVSTPADRVARLLTANRSGGTLRYFAESAGGTVAVVDQTTSRAQFRRLYIQGVSNSGDALTSLRYMRLQALLPLIVHPGEPRSSLVIGFGTGITAGALLQYPGLERRVCAELLPAVVEAAPLFQGNYGAPAGLDLRVRDGRRELLSSDERYDLITLEPPPPSAAGVVNLYSRDFYRLAQRRLAPGGVVAQWWPLPTQNDEESRSLVRAFLDVFPHASVWTTELHEMLLVGSDVPMPLDYPRIRQRFEQPTVQASLTEVGIASVDALLATWIAGRPALDRYAGSASAVTDNDPRIEYATWVRPREVTRVLPILLALSAPPPLENADDASTASIAAERARLHAFYAAALAAYRGDRASAGAGLKAILAAEPDNPYYRWFAMGPPGQ